jgi:hypothetical protein
MAKVISEQFVQCKQSKVSFERNDVIINYIITSPTFNEDCKTKNPSENVSMFSNFSFNACIIWMRTTGNPKRKREIVRTSVRSIKLILWKWFSCFVNLDDQWIYHREILLSIRWFLFQYLQYFLFGIIWRRRRKKNPNRIISFFIYFLCICSQEHHKWFLFFFSFVRDLDIYFFCILWICSNDNTNSIYAIGLLCVCVCFYRFSCVAWISWLVLRVYVYVWICYSTPSFFFLLLCKRCALSLLLSIE